jgi:hypothetical protein
MEEVKPSPNMTTKRSHTVVSALDLLLSVCFDVVGAWMLFTEVGGYFFMRTI